MTLTIPGLGSLAAREYGWLESGLVEVQALGSGCRFIIDGFEPVETMSLTTSIESFCCLTEEAVKGVAGEHVWTYYRDFAVHSSDWPGLPSVPSEDLIWDFVTFGKEIWVRRLGSHWYLSVESECAWEPEHGLDLVFEDGRKLVKVGQVDGHVTNRQSYGDDAIPEDAVYWSPF